MATDSYKADGELEEEEVEEEGDKEEVVNESAIIFASVNICAFRHALASDSNNAIDAVQRKHLNEYV